MGKAEERGKEGKKVRPPEIASPVTPGVPAGFVEIGRIVAAQGLKGEVRVYPDSDFPERFVEVGTRWLLLPGQSEPQSVELVSGRYLEGKGLYILQLKGITDRNQAEALRGAMLLVSADDRPPLEEDEFHVLDLIGLEVFDQQGTLVGRVVQVIPAGNDLLEVERPSSSDGTAKPDRVLIPFVKAIVPVVDLDQKRIEITPPPGLIDPVEE
jgi:16S rRNA processing protein RimM